MLQEGKGVSKVARLARASPSSVSRWKQALEAGGKDALKNRKSAASDTGAEESPGASVGSRSMGGGIRHRFVDPGASGAGD